MPGYPPSTTSEPAFSPLFLPKGNRRAVRSGDLRKLLNEELSETVALPEVARRIVSDPLPRRPSSFAKELGAVVARATSMTVPVEPAPPSSLAFSNLVRGRRRSRATSISLSPPQPNPSKTPTRSASVSSESDTVQPKTSTQHPNPALPIGTARPVPLSTHSLTPRSHKTIQGHVTVLPSRSLLVDFREGERRRGNPGDQVIIISSDGLDIKVFDAPHLSAPCCLAEHIAEYKISSLPSSFWKQYNDASELLDRIKQRTPKLVLHEHDIKSTLMGNGPLADIELLFLSPSVSREREDISESARMRLRLSRQRLALEIARCKIDTRGKEWKKKTLSVTAPHYQVTDRKRLDCEEREALSSLADFLSLCGYYEQYSQDNTLAPAASRLSVKTQTDLDNTQPMWRSNIRSRILTTSALNAPTITAPSFPLRVPQPSKSRSSRSIIDKENMPDCSASTSILANQATFESIPSWKMDSLDTSVRPVGVGSRYIPSVGWCIRQCSNVSQGGHYKILFLDGAALDVDVDEEWVELRDRTGSVTRYAVRDKHIERAIGDRMRVFQEFVSMFEDDE